MKMPSDTSPGSKLENDDWVIEGNWEVVTDTESLQEAANSAKVDNGIIGVIRGPFFFPDGISQNERFYPRDLWESVLSQKKVTSKLESRTMFGQIGHNDRPVSDQDLAEGKVSHIISKLFIQGNEGLGEALILDTPAGRNLLAPLKAGAKIKISSRATGSFSEERKGPRGLPVVDPNKYVLETFDFVINAGFPDTNPQLAEGKTNKKTSTMENPDMYEKLMESREKSQRQLTETLGQLDEAQAEIARLKKELDEAKAGSDEKNKVLSLTESVAGSFGTTVPELIEMLENSDIRAIQTVSKLNLTEETLRGYVELGTPEEIAESVDQAIESLTEFRSIGDPEEIQEVMDMVEDSLNQYLQFGSVNELIEKMQRLREYEEKSEEERITETAFAKAKEYGLDVAVVERLVAKFDDESELDSVLESLSGSNRPSGRGLNEDTSNLWEDDEDRPEFLKKQESSGASRLFERLGGPTAN